MLLVAAAVSGAIQAIQAIVHQRLDGALYVCHGCNVACAVASMKGGVQAIGHGGPVTGVYQVIVVKLQPQDLHR